MNPRNLVTLNTQGQIRFRVQPGMCYALAQKEGSYETIDYRL